MFNQVIKLREKTEVDLDKLNETLSLCKEHQSAYIIASKLGWKPAKVRRLIRLLKMRGVGILPGRGGYILSAYADQRDDVFLIKKVYGRHASDVITISAARSDMEKRWRRPEDRRALQALLGPINIDLSNTRSVKLLTEYSEKIEV
jgi:biotin operon repressor